MFLKSRRSMRWPYLFRSTSHDGTGLDGFGAVITKLAELDAVIEAQEANEVVALELEEVVFVDVRVSALGAGFGGWRDGCAG
jgi:hypothetical protein